MIDDPRAHDIQHPPAYNAELGAQIRKLRQESGYTLKEFASEIPGTPHFTTVSKLEKGQIPVTGDWIERIATALGVSPLAITIGQDFEGYEPRRVPLYGPESVDFNGGFFHPPTGWAPAVKNVPGSFAVSVWSPEGGPGFGDWQMVVDPNERELRPGKLFAIKAADNVRMPGWNYGNVFAASYYPDPPQLIRWPDCEPFAVGEFPFRVLGLIIFQSRIPGS